MNDGAVRLSSLPEDVWFDCSRCHRKAVYSRQALINRYGDILAPDLRFILAENEGCKNVGSTGYLHRCGARFPDLIPSKG